MPWHVVLMFCTYSFYIFIYICINTDQAISDLKIDLYRIIRLVIFNATVLFPPASWSICIPAIKHGIDNVLFLYSFSQLFSIDIDEY